MSSVGIAVACALVIIANAPPILTDPLFTAVAQIRVNAATTSKPPDMTEVPLNSESSTQSEVKRTNALPRERKGL